MSVEIRDVERMSEYEACAHLQLDVWQFDPIEVVPAGYGSWITGTFGNGTVNP